MHINTKNVKKYLFTLLDVSLRWFLYNSSTYFFISKFNLNAKITPSQHEISKSLSLSQASFFVIDPLSSFRVSVHGEYCVSAPHRHTTLIYQQLISMLGTK